VGGAIRNASRKRWLLGLQLLLALACLECASALAVRLAPAEIRTALRPVREREAELRGMVERMLHDDGSSLAVFDAQLGWRPRPGLRHGLDVIDSVGARSTREYATLPPAGTWRIAAFGDSFVYGSEVRTEEAWPARLEQALENSEVLNLGVPGYGPDQAYLRFLEEVGHVYPHTVIFAISTPALLRIGTVSAVFQTERPHFLAKPRFELDEAGRLTLQPNPIQRLQDLQRFAADPAALRELGAHDDWYEPLVFENPLYDRSYAVRIGVNVWTRFSRRFLDPDRPVVGGPGSAVLNASSRGFTILTQLIEAFVSRAEELDMQPLVLLLPDGFSVARSRAGGEGTLDPLARWCAGRSFVCWDASPAFADPSADFDAWFHARFHYSDEGNARLAGWLARELATLPRSPRE
jgi:hypothetical protein